VSPTARRFRRRGQPIVGEHLDAVEARYTNPQGESFRLEINLDTGFDPHRLYLPLRGIVTEVLLVDEAFDSLDALAASPDAQQNMTTDDALHALLTVHWLAYHGHIPSAGRDGGMLFYFSRPHPKKPGQRIGFVRETLEATRAEEKAFERNAIRGEVDGTMVKVTPRVGESFAEATVRGLEDWLARSSR
jgi:hypothetical protein